MDEHFGGALADVVAVFGLVESVVVVEGSGRLVGGLLVTVVDITEKLIILVMRK